MTPHDRMRRLLGIAALLAAMLLALLVIGTARSAGGQKRPREIREETPPPAAETRSPDDGDALRREVALLRREVAERRAEPAASEAPVGDEAERQRLLAESDRRILAQAEANEAALQAQPVDGTWSRQARDVIAEAFAADALAGTSAVDVECRSTLCRLRVSHADGAARARFEHQFGLLVARVLPQLMAQQVEGEGGEATSILYLAREGHTFPGSN